MFAEIGHPETIQWRWRFPFMANEVGTNITSSTLTRWLVSALAALVVAGAGFWMNAIYGQLDRIERSLTQRIEGIETTLAQANQQHSMSTSKTSDLVVDLKIDNALLKARIEQLEKEIGRVVNIPDDSIKRVK